MYQDWMEKVPYITNLDIFIDNGIEELERTRNAYKREENKEMVELYDEKIIKYRNRKQELMKMSKFKRWLHCERQYWRSQSRLSKIIKEINKHKERCY